MRSMRENAVLGIKKGDRFSVTRTFSEADMLGFAEVSRDYNPVHFDERFARSRGFSGRICHGLLVGAMLTEIGGQIGCLATGMDFRFKKAVYLNQTVTCVLEITEVDEKGRVEAEAVFTDEQGEVVMTATLCGVMPADEQKRVMKRMLAEGDPTNKAARHGN
ncbi:MAG: MaoC family dehydratase [Desulfobacteraceae bacterium]|nr:MaoC family dehydratase [Desulfobacteraceae bacterium]